MILGIAHNHECESELIIFEGDGCYRRESDGLSLLSLSSRGDTESRSFGRPVGRSVGKAPSQASLGVTLIKTTTQIRYCHPVTLSLPLHPAHNLTQKLLDPLLSPIN